MKYYAVRKGHHPRIISGEWREVEPEIKKEISGFRNPEWKGFRTKAEADAYMEQGKPVKSVSDAVDPEDALAASFQFTADAVIFVDGSRNFDREDFDHEKPNRKPNKKKNFYYGSYGIIIFYRDGSVYVESARVDDGERETGERPYITVAHHGFTLRAGQVEPEVYDCTEKIEYLQCRRQRAAVEFEEQYVLASWNIAGEVEGVRQALDLCLRKRDLQNAYVFFDCDQIDIVKKIANGKNPALQSNVTCNYGEFCREIIRQKKHVGTMHIYSHSKGKKRGMDYDHRLELFNSCADVLAKAETYNKPIDPAVENRPLGPYGLVPFQRELVYSDHLDENEIKQAIDARRRQAFELVRKVISDQSVHPHFVK